MTKRDEPSHFERWSKIIKDMPIRKEPKLVASFDATACYELFLAVDDRVRQLPPHRRSATLCMLREELLPFYAERHANGEAEAGK